MLKLDKPLAFLDLETTGINLGGDRIVEISILKISPDGKEESLTMRINPGRPFRRNQLLFMVLVMKM